MRLPLPSLGSGEGCAGLSSGPAWQCCATGAEHPLHISWVTSALRARCGGHRLGGCARWCLGAAGVEIPTQSSYSTSRTTLWPSQAPDLMHRFLGRRNKSPQTWWRKTTGRSRLPVLGATSLKSKAALPWMALFLGRLCSSVLGRFCSLPLPASRGCRHPLVYSCVTAISTSEVTSPAPLLSLCVPSSSVF